MVNGMSIDKRYIVRHYSHLYVAEKVKQEGKYGYYRLLSIYKEHIPQSVSVGHSLRFHTRKLNNYVGDIVKKEMSLVHVLEETESKEQELTLAQSIMSIVVFVALLLIIMVSCEA